MADSIAAAVTPSAPAATDAPSTETNTPVELQLPKAPTAKAEPKKAEATPAQPKKYKIKVDSREEELDEDSVVKLAQLGRASDKRFQEAAKMRKEAEDFIKMMKADPAKVLSNPAIGVDVRKWAEEFLAKELEKESLSPEQKKIREYEERLKKHDDDAKASAAQKEQDDFQKLQAHYAQEFDTKITGALQTAGLPKSPKTVKRMADYMSLALNNGIDLEPKDVVELVRQDYVNEISDLFGQTDGDKLLQILGDGVANKIRKADLARLRNPVATQANPAEVAADLASTEEPTVSKPMPRKSSTATTNPADKKMNIHEWRAAVDKRAGK